MERTKYMEILYLLLQFSLYCFLQGYVNGEPCTTAIELPFLGIRTSNYKTDTSGGEQFICDKNIIPVGGDWYTVGSNDITRNETVIFTCATQYAIWANGTLPKAVGEEVSLNACIPGNNNSCINKLHIKVRNCGTFNVYFLQRPDHCPVSYCFGPGDTGRSPDVSSTKPKVTFSMQRKQNGRIDTQQLIVHCSFTARSNNNYMYQVFWFIDGIMRSSTSPVTFSNINTTNLIEQQNGILTKAGVNIVCGVRIRLTKAGIPGNISPLSDAFYVGIKARQVAETLQKDGIVSLSLQPTVPIGCGYKNKQSDEVAPCYLMLKISTPVSPECKSSQLTENNDFCHLDILNTEWNQDNYYNVSILDDGLFGTTSNYVIRFRTVRHALQEMWSNYHVPDIKININTNQIVSSGSVCILYNGVVTTFDNMHFRFAGANNVFTLYEIHEENESKSVEVQIQAVNSRYLGTVSVRAGGDVIRVDEYANFRFMSRKDNIISVRKKNYFTLEIIIPEIFISVSSFLGWYTRNNIYIRTTRGSNGKTKGLCGNNDGIRSDEFHGTGTGFFNNNRVPIEKHLFRMDQHSLNQLTRWDNMEYFCSCPSSGITYARTLTCSRQTSIMCRTRNLQ